MASLPSIAPETLSASSRSSEKLRLPVLQSKMKTDPEGYQGELQLILSQFSSSLVHFQQQAALNFNSIAGVGGDPTMAKDLGDFAMFLAHVTPFYPKQLNEFPKELVAFLTSSARTLPSSLRCNIAQALILLVNRKIIDLSETLSLFMELQTLGDRNMRKLAFSHVVHSIRRMNKKHKNEAKNKALQHILFEMLKQEDEARARRSLVTLCELYRRKVWSDDRTAEAICYACFHSSSRIMISALLFLLDYEKIENDDDDDSDASSSEDETTQSPQVVISKEAMYKAHHKGTAASKKKKKAKLQRAIRSMKRQQRMSSESSTYIYNSPLNYLKNPQGFAEGLFSILRTCNERFEVKMMMLKVIARTIGLHRLILLDFYRFLQKYVQPHQKEITSLLAAAVQACHDMVPPEAVQDLFKQLVNQFVHDRSRPEVIAVGLNVIREICLRMPLLMTEELLQDLALYKKSHEKAVSAASRSLIALFRQVCPSLLVKKDRGRPIDPKARPRAFGEANVLTNVPGAELLQQDIKNDDSEDGDDSDEITSMNSDDDLDENENFASSDDELEDQLHGYNNEGKDDDLVEEEEEDDDDDENEDDSDISLDADEEEEDGSVDAEEVEAKEDEEHETNDNAIEDGGQELTKSKARKRKISDFDGQLVAADTSLRALKRLAEAKLGGPTSDSTDGILSNEDFQRIKELKAKKEAKIALAQQGFKVPSSEQLSVKRVDPAMLEAHIRHKLTKEERLALVRAGREDREKYQARTAVKQKKTGGLSNRQKEHKKAMPLAAKRAKAAKSRQEKRKKQQRSGKQFRGKKAWK
ncbi:hypothetical protein SLE2022_123900 [Rubroshorea leprosula]